MRPTKRTKAVKKPRKRAVKKAYDSKSPLGRLLKLKYRINESCVGGEFYDASTSMFGTHDIGDMKSDKTWVMEEITNLKDGGWLSAVKMKVANEMWNKYNG